MAHYAEEDDFYQQEAEEPYDNQMEERLVQALGHHVQDSVNQALIKVLKPFTQPLVSFGQRELMSGPSCARVPDTMTGDMSRTQKGSGGPKFSAEILSQMASSVLRDHEYEQDIYEIPSGLHSQDVLGQEDSQSSAAHTPDSERSRDEPKMSDVEEDGDFWLVRTEELGSNGHFRAEDGLEGNFDAGDKGFIGTRSRIISAGSWLSIGPETCFPCGQWSSGSGESEA
ncbi:hypothetical protein NDU88_001751 [Pleurodeles waltl]|uniref:Uncharacterized protein n=1 Tax=Pleurodeles waltl TaxID=8319 RepID=A0AAV7LYJ5_PLEWA|nr:hypothetical protein NDU88_001751 [Pleurodeles waltl]